MHRTLPSPGVVFARRFALALTLALAGCQAGPDPCVSNASDSDTPVACGEGKLRVLAKLPVTSEEWESQIAFSRHRVALDDKYAYWSDYKGRILRTPKAGGPTDVVLEASECTIADLAVDEVGVYFGQNCLIPELEKMVSFPVLGKVSWLEKATGERHELAAQKLMDVREVTVRDGIVYWTLSTESSTSTLHRVPRDQPILSDAQVVKANAVYLPFGLSTDRVVWLEGSTKDIRISPLPGGRGDRLAGASALVEWLAVEGDAAFWLERTIIEMGAVERRLFRVPLAGGEVTEPLPGLVTEHMVTDGADYYGAGDNSATNQTAYRVYRWRAPDFVPETLAAGFSAPESIAVDDTHVFVVDHEPFEKQTLRLVRISR